MKSSNKLLSPQKAVENYLDTLLQEVTEPQLSAEPEEKTQQSESDARDDLNQQQEPQEKASPVAETEITIPQNQHQIIATEKKTTIQADSLIPSVAIEPSKIVETLENVQIENFQRYDFPIQCLMFNVSGNMLSIPLIDMGSVLPWGAKLTPLPHTPEWFLGLLIHREQNVRVVDTAQFMQIQRMKSDDDNRHILVFGNDSWAMTCDRLGQVIKLNEKDVKWSKQGNAGLMLGTIKSSLAVLLDPKKILLKLNQGM